MKVTLFGSRKNEIEEMVRELGFKIVETDPEFVLCYGGDGTLIFSEHLFPDVPKVLLKSSAICKLCEHAIENKEALKLLKENKYSIREFWKVEAEAKGKKLYALNDIVVHNEDPRHAIRYTIHVNGRQVGQEIIGDGVVVSTPIGSTGYYRSITDSVFETGLGLAFNNSTEQSDHIVLKEDSVITFKVARGPAMVYADNQPEEVELAEGEEVKIWKSEKTAKLVRFL